MQLARCCIGSHAKPPVEGVILCELADPRNVGAALRQMGCLRFGALLLVGDSVLARACAGSGPLAQKKLKSAAPLPLLGIVRAASKGCGRPADLAGPLSRCGIHVLRPTQQQKTNK